MSSTEMAISVRRTSDYRRARICGIDEGRLVKRQPFDFSGEFYQVRGGIPMSVHLQRPHPLLFFGGASPGALEWREAL